MFHVRCLLIPVRPGDRRAGRPLQLKGQALRRMKQIYFFKLGKHLKRYVQCKSIPAVQPIQTPQVSPAWESETAD
jgi:hypothetical protein